MSRTHPTVLPLPLEIVIEKVSVQQCLQDSTKVHDPVMLVVLLGMGTIDPVEDVERPVRTHEEDVVPRQVLDFAVPLQNNQLGQDGNSLEVDRKRP